MPPPTVLTPPSSARDPPNPPVQPIILPGIAHLPAHPCIAEDCPHEATPPSRSPFAHGWPGPPRGLAVTVCWPRPWSPSLGPQPRTRKDGVFLRACGALSPSSPAVCLPGLSTYSDIQTSCGSPKLPTSCTSCRSPPRFLPLLCPQSRLLGALSGRPSLGRSRWPVLSPDSGPHLTPASRFLPARTARPLLALPARGPSSSPGSRRHCLEPPVRRRGPGGLGGRGPLLHRSPSLSLPAAASRASWSDSH